MGSYSPRISMNLMQLMEMRHLQICKKISNFSIINKKYFYPHIHRMYIRWLISYNRSISDTSISSESSPQPSSRNFPLLGRIVFWRVSIFKQYRLLQSEAHLTVLQCSVLAHALCTPYWCSVREVFCSDGDEIGVKVIPGFPWANNASIGVATIPPLNVSSLEILLIVVTTSHGFIPSGNVAQFIMLITELSALLSSIGWYVSCRQNTLFHAILRWTAASCKRIGL